MTIQASNWVWVDEFIEDALGGYLGTYAAFNESFRGWVLTEKGKHLTPAEAALLLQWHKLHMAAAKYYVKCERRGPYAEWTVCEPPDGEDALRIKVDELTRDLMADSIWRATVISASDKILYAQVIAETRAVMALANGQRQILGLKGIDISGSLAARKVLVTV